MKRLRKLLAIFLFLVIGQVYPNNIPVHDCQKVLLMGGELIERKNNYAEFFKIFYAQLKKLIYFAHVLCIIYLLNVPHLLHM